jgi:hypothetical protein
VVGTGEELDHQEVGTLSGALIRRDMARQAEQLRGRAALARAQDDLRVLRSLIALLPYAVPVRVHVPAPGVLDSRIPRQRSREITLPRRIR